MAPDDRLGGLDGAGGSAARGDAEDRGGGSAVRGRLARVFSPRHFLVALVASFAGLWIGGLVPLVGGFTRFLGLLVATFCLGALAGRRVYAEVALASAVATVVALLGGLLTSAFFPLAASFLARYGVAFALGAGGLGVVVGVVGYYLGRDLRAGLTRSL